MATDPSTVVDGFINSNQAFASQQANTATAYANTAQTLAESQLSLTELDVSKPVVNLVPFNPDTDLYTLFINGFNGVLPDFLGELQAAINDFLNRFMPNSCIITTADNWICNTITNGGTGIPPAVENAIWERARSREIVEATRMEAEAANQFAARGFSLPPGVLANRMMTVQQEAANKSATISRDTAIKNVEIEIENIRFAVGEAVKLRSAIMEALARYIHSYMLPVEYAVEYATRLVDAKAKLWSLVADYDRALVSVAELGLRADEVLVRQRETFAQVVADFAKSNTQLRVNAALGAAEQLGKMAASALAASNSLAVTAAQSNITG